MSGRVTKVLVAAALVAAGSACHRPVSPEVLAQWQGRTLYTCCNLHYENPEISDANYFVGSTVPFGSAATVSRMTDDSVTFTAGGATLTLYHSYGRDQEPNQQYFQKILVETDPRTVFARYPKQVQDAITEGRVERGMTKEQVVMSLGYPPTHRTASTDMNTWTYWYNRWVTYQVQFGEDGTVANVIGRPAPTRDEPIVAPTPAPTPRPVRKGKGRY